MLDRGGDDVPALISQREVHALEREVIGLTAAAGEDNLIAVATKQSCYLIARRLKSGLGSSGSPMSARRVTVMIVKKGAHRGGDSGIDRRAGVVVEVYALHSHDTVTSARPKLLLDLVCVLLQSREK